MKTEDLILGYVITIGGVIFYTFETELQMRIKLSTLPNY